MDKCIRIIFTERGSFEDDPQEDYIQQRKIITCEKKMVEMGWYKDFLENGSMCPYCKKEVENMFLTYDFDQHTTAFYTDGV